MRTLHATLCASFVVASLCCAQSPVSVSPSQLSFSIAQGGPLGPRQTFTVATTRKWTAKPDGNDLWISLNPAAGTGQTTVTAALGNSDWRPVGNLSTRITVTTEDGATAVVAVTLRIVARLPPPLFSYIDGPHRCTQPPGYPDAATCTVPDERPTGTFEPPPQGGTYVDPNFGAKVRILGPVRSLHGYSTPSSFSAHNKYALVSIDGVTSIVEVATGRVHSRPQISVEGPMWDAADEQVLYHVAGATVRKYDLRSQNSTVLVDYSGAPYRFTNISTGSIADTTKDNWFAFLAPAERSICALDLKTQRTYCATYSQPYGGVTPNPGNGGALMSKGVDSATGKRYVVLEARPVVVYSVNQLSGTLDYEFVGPELMDWGGNNDGVCNPGEKCLPGDHFDTAEDSAGVQYLMGGLETPTPCEYSLNSIQLNKGTRGSWPVEMGGGLRRIMTLFRCGGGDVWTDWHLGCAKSGKHCVVSTTYDAFNKQRDAQTPIRRTPHLGEIFVIRDNGAEVRRLVQHRSVPLIGEEARSYWTTPRACISPDASFVIADSNFGFPDKNRVMLIETGFGKTKMASDPGVVDAASLEPRIAPGKYATIYGENLAHCRASAGRLPLPDSLCGTTVKVNGLNVRLSYVSPSQVNVLLPQALPPQEPAQVVLKRGDRADEGDTLLVPATALAAIAPAVFSYSLEDGLERAIVQYPGGELNSPARPMQPGEAGTLYVNGMGPVAPAVEDGFPASDNPLSHTVNKVRVLINDRPQLVQYAGLVPFLAGLYQVNFVLDAETPLRAGNDNRVQVEVKDTVSSALPISLGIRSEAGSGEGRSSPWLTQSGLMAESHRP